MHLLRATTAETRLAAKRVRGLAEDARETPRGPLWPKDDAADDAPAPK